ncbi:hypothetical protein [Rubrivivax gelatinosus]|uniref:hypothetical protein n=1 Tax=Rubrivivax gelatinosus TaxID=28068 RepID=UPI00130EDC6B|nr:hypothetical protein [Rubrivivax gelatinosus]
MPLPLSSSSRLCLLSAAAACVLAGCASAPAGIDAQWRAPDAGRPLGGGVRVLVACEAAETALVRLCVERFSAELTARGATAVAAPDAPPPAAAGPRDDARYVALARQAGAQAVWVGSVSAAPAEPRSSGMSIGLGGFHIGGGGSGVGVGVTLPVGSAGTAAVEYAAEARITEVAGGRLQWTARAASGGGGDAGAQLDGLSRRLVDAAAAAGLF